MTRKSIVLVAAAFGLVAAARAQNPFQTGNESQDIQTRRGNPSPTAGFSAGETNSNIDDYSHMDEQVNINPDSGVVKVLRVNQKNLINDYVTRLIPIENVHPREVRNVMRVVTGMEGGRAEVVRDKVGGKAYVQVICPKFQLPAIEAAVRALDVPWLKQGVDGSTTKTYFPRYRDADSLDDIASTYAGEGATRVDTILNAVTRRDEPFRTDKYIDACRRLDIPAPQAHIRFRVYEIDTNNDLSLGVDWIAWKNGPGRTLFDLILGGQESHETFDNATGHFNPNLGTTTLVGDGDVHVDTSQYLLAANYVLTSAFLDFLRVKGKARVLAEADVFVQSGETGTWASTDQFLTFDVEPEDPDAFGIEPVRLNKVSVVDVNGDGKITAADADADGVLTLAAPPADFAVHNRFLNHNVGPKNSLGLELNVFPVIGTESAEVEVEFISDDLAGTTPQGTPIITHRRIVTKLRLVDGQPFVFGGLTRDEDVKSSNKAPWLGDIPILGYLFGQENTAARRKEIVITAVPHFYGYNTAHTAEYRDDWERTHSTRPDYPAQVEDAVARDTIAMALGQKQKAFGPKNCFGFDKWILDRVEHP